MTFHLGGGDNPPDWCLQANSRGELPTCTYSDGSWHRSYEGGVGGMEGGGIPAGFVLVFVLALIATALLVAYKVSMARSMATRSGMDPDDATRMTLLTDNGLEATYLASNLRPQPQASPPPAPEPVPAGVAVRLRELKGLLDEGLITQDEYDARRRVILDQT